MNHTRTLLAALTVIAVITFVLICAPHLVQNIVNDLIARR